MSTSCQVIVKDQKHSIWFYRHSDGYPEGVRDSLSKFLQWVKEGKIRANAEQAAGWLVIIGHDDYNAPKESMNWKVGTYEPCAPEEHVDIEFLYTVDLAKKQITYRDIYAGKNGILE